ncbi:MAG: (2Fe-2S)-binding protein [Pseudomonadota bacterium]
MTTPKRHISLTVNGTYYELYVPANRTLLDLIREDLTLTGTKKGCDEGECGACSVLVDGRAMNACLVLAPDANGKNITTIEGIGQPGKLHPLQKAFLEEGAVQCGYCTPGMIMQALDLLGRNPSPTPFEVREGMVGNLCRCTGYEKIVRAIVRAARELKQERLKILKEAMKRKLGDAEGKKPAAKMKPEKKAGKGKKIVRTRKTGKKKGHG